MDNPGGLRSYWPKWQITVSLTGIIIVAGAAAVAAWPHALWWLIVITAGAVAGAPPALAVLGDASSSRRMRGRRARAVLRGTRGGAGTLPTARNAGLEATVHQAVLPIPYISRDTEEIIRQHLQEGLPVLLIGTSMIGKTMMAVRVVTSHFGDIPVIIPDSKAALAELDAADLSPQGCVIWLDDLNNLIGTDGITPGSLQHLANAGNIIIGTMRSAEYDRLRPTDQLRLPEWDVISRFERIFVERKLSPSEQRRLEEAISDPEIRERIRTIGIGEYVGAAGQIAEALQLGAAGTGGFGYALVLAAADWRRCGLSRAIPAALLPELAAPYVEQRRLGHLPDPEEFRAGLAWAMRQINPNVSLLEPTGKDGYTIYDYALDLLTQQGNPIPAHTWAIVIEHADEAELVKVGFIAQATHHQSHIAIEALQKAVRSEQDNIVTPAAFGLGAVLSVHGDKDMAKVMLQKAIDSEDKEAARLATVILAELLKAQGDVEGAKAMLQRAIDSGHAWATPTAALQLGALLQEKGDVRGAKAAFQRAIDTGNADVAPMGIRGLAQMLREEGDVEGAKAAFQQAIDSGHADATPLAAVHLSELLQEEGDVEGAEAAFQRAIDFGHADATPRAAAVLGGLLATRGDIEQAKAALQRAIDSEDKEAAALATAILAQVLDAEGDVGGAKAVLQQAIDSGDEHAAALATATMAELFEEEGTQKG